MRKFITLFIVLFFYGQLSFGQQQSRKVQYLDANFSFAQYEGSLALGYFYDWQFGKNRKIEIGVGARFTGYLGADKFLITAPAKLTSGSTGPGVLFKENIDVNIDTLIIKYPQVNSLNLLIDLGYRLNDKWKVGFNVDLIGFSFGGSKRGNFVSRSSGRGKMEEATPTPFNLLLISDNDLGNLNSELYAKYFINKTWGIKAGFQFLFTEYTTKSKVQEIPEQNDRFRLKSLMFSVGVSRKL